jgi:glycosyltransferase involved in cell wall biosynthesis
MTREAPTVAHVTPWYLPHIGGLERHVESISTGLPGFNFLIFTPRMPGTSANDKLDDRVQICRFGPPKFPAEPRRRPLAAPRDWIARSARLANLRKALRENRFDILHIHRPPIIELAYLAASRGENVPLQRLSRRLNQLPNGGRRQVFTDHGLFILPSSTSPLELRWFMEWVLEEYDHVICVDPSGYERAAAIRDSDPSRFSSVTIHHIPQPIDTDSFRPTPMPDSKDLVVGYSGRWERDGMFLLESLVTNPPLGLRFVISGGATSRDLERFAPSLKRDTVDLQPNLLSISALVHFYRRIHVLVDFYRGDGTGRSVLEAMASGRAVVRIRARDTYPIVDGETGILVDPSLKSIHAALGDLAGDPDRVFKLGCAAREAVARDYGLRRVLRQIDAIYRQCLRDR